MSPDTGSKPEAVGGRMWTCPDCERSFANTNQWHACQTTSLAEALEGRTDLAVSVTQRVIEGLREAGSFRIHPQRTRIAFISRMTFAGVSLARNWVDLSFLLPESLEDRRIRRLELFGPTSWGHTVRLASPSAVDGEVRGWLADALRRGDQETLDSGAEVKPLSTAQLGVFRAAFRGRVSRHAEGLVVILPGYLTEALALVDVVSVRMVGVTAGSTLHRAGGAAWLEIDPGLGLGDGDQTDILLTSPF